jgi:hypothetical protein
MEWRAWRSRAADILMGKNAERKFVLLTVFIFLLFFIPSWTTGYLVMISIFGVDLLSIIITL